MGTDRGLTDLAATLADGAAVDWAALEAELGSDAERAIFRQLRVIADIAELHRSLPGEDFDPRAFAATPAAPLAPEGAPGATVATNGTWTLKGYSNDGGAASLEGIARGAAEGAAKGAK